MKNRKGFTIVELVIVIAVIAILAAVLIPTFSGVIGKANVSARTQEFTNALKVVLAGNAETGALADGTIFVGSEKNEANYYAYYNGNKLGDITAIADGNDKLLVHAEVTENVELISVTVKKDKNDSGTAYNIKSVILPFKAETETPDAASLAALGTFFGGTAAYASNKVTVTISEKTLTLNCYSNLDLAKGMFVLSPTK